MTENKKEFIAPTAIVVNDDPLQLKLLSALLTKGGFRTVSFLNAAEALACMNENSPPDIVVTDLYMPELDGWRFCRLLRSPEYISLNTIPILVISATFSGEATSRITSEIGANAFLSAPVDGRELIETANALLQGNSLMHLPHVLIATDDHIISESLEDVFSINGYEALAVFSCAEICKVLEKDQSDILILEHHLIEGSDDDVFEKLHECNPDCISVIITDDPNPELALSWMKRGVSAYVRKPFTPEQIRGVVEEVLGVQNDGES